MVRAIVLAITHTDMLFEVNWGIACPVSPLNRSLFTREEVRTITAVSPSAGALSSCLSHNRLLVMLM